MEVRYPCVHEHQHALSSRMKQDRPNERRQHQTRRDVIIVACEICRIEYWHRSEAKKRRGEDEELVGETVGFTPRVVKATTGSCDDFPLALPPESRSCYREGAPWSRSSRWYVALRQRYRACHPGQGCPRGGELLGYHVILLHCMFSP